MLEEAQTFSGIKTFSDGIAVSSSGLIQTYRYFSTNATNWGIGPASILDGSTLSSSTTYGTYVVNGAWDTSNSTTHTITSTDFLLNAANTNVTATFRVLSATKPPQGQN